MGAQIEINQNVTYSLVLEEEQVDALRDIVNAIQSAKSRSGFWRSIQLSEEGYALADELHSILKQLYGEEPLE